MPSIHSEGRNNTLGGQQRSKLAFSLNFLKCTFFGANLLFYTILFFTSFVPIPTEAALHMFEILQFLSVSVEELSAVIVHH